MIQNTGTAELRLWKMLMNLDFEFAKTKPLKTKYRVTFPYHLKNEVQGNMHWFTLAVVYKD